MKGRSVSKTTSVKKKKLKSLLLAMELGLQLLRKEKFQKWKEKTNWMFATTCWLGWWKGKRKNFNDTQCQICIGFCLCFVLFLSNSTLKVLEAIVEFDRFCHLKEEPHLLNSYGEGQKVHLLMFCMCSEDVLRLTKKV